jgi:hypothetical protein
MHVEALPHLLELRMKCSPNRWCPVATLLLSLTGCVTAIQPAPQRHLTEQQCRDLTAIRNHAPPSRERSASELAALEEAGYDPNPLWDDPYYPDDLQAAQQQVDQWYRVECVGAASR